MHRRVEASVYIRHDMHRRGLGRAAAGGPDRAGPRRRLSLADRRRQRATRPASIALQESLGFQRVAHFKEVGYKFGQWLDVVFLQLMLK